MMIPLSRDGYVGCALSAIGCVLLTCLLGGFGFFWKILPFAVFFAWHPLVNKLQKKNGRLPWLWWAVKAAWFDGMLFLAYFVTFEMNVSFDWLNAYIVPVLLVCGTLGFLIYDKLIFLCQRSVDALVRRIGRK